MNKNHDILKSDEEILQQLPLLTEEMQNKLLVFYKDKEKN